MLSVIYAKYHKKLFMLSVVLLNVTMLSVVMLNVIMLSVVPLSTMKNTLAYYC